MKILKKILSGIAWGSTFFVISGIIAALNSDAFFIETNSQFITQAIASIICGISFCVPTIVYDNEKIPMPLKVLIHMGTGLTVYLLIALWIGWIPIKHGVLPMIITVLGMIILSFVIWGGFYFYYRMEAKNINKKIKEK